MFRMERVRIADRQKDWNEFDEQTIYIVIGNLITLMGENKLLPL